ncbi:Vps52p [Nakaseomyces bracarensis]|uniref:Vps52p n=1 Tax=Nakaseomyces bracarensis TaxID=273131 RepID=UPI003871713D
METLFQTLGTTRESLGDVKGETSDIYEEFVVEHNRLGGLANQKLWEEREHLEERRQNIERTVEQVLPPLKTYLNEFQEQLSSHTSDLDQIREKSQYLKTLLEFNSEKLKNISPLVNDLIIPPEVIQDILHGKINESWQENIDFIRDKKVIYDKYKKDDSNCLKPKDFKDLCDILGFLNMAILERSKKFIIFKKKSLRSNIPIASQKLQYDLMNVSKLFQFMVENNLSMALELRQAYAYTMRWYYHSYFARYIRSLTILRYKSIDYHYILGNGLTVSPNGMGGDASASFGFSSYLMPTSFTTSAVSSDDINNYFQVEKRIDLLTKEDNTVMVSQIAETNQRENYLEIGYKNLNLAILDNCSSEYKFLASFFRVDAKSNDELNGLLEKIFQPTFTQAIEFTEQLIQSTYDIFGILISIRITNLLQFECSRRELPSVIDNFLNSQLITLWPKFQQLVDVQCQNIRKVTILTRSKESADNLTTPHELTIQFGKMLFSLLTLSVSHKNNIDERSEPLYQSISRIRNEFETVMTKLSKMTASPEQFLGTNYLYLYNILLQQRLSHMSREAGLTPAVDEGKFVHESDEQSKNSEVPLIIRESEHHFKALVEAFNKK